MQLIDAELLLHWVEKLEAYNMGRASCFKKPKGLTPEGIRHMIDTMPKVDVVPVLRCKDCKQYNGHRYCYYSELAVLDDDFCNYGERKDNDI